jgi:hypothetical protein
VFPNGVVGSAAAAPPGVSSSTRTEVGGPGRHADDRTRWKSRVIQEQSGHNTSLRCRATGQVKVGGAMAFFRDLGPGPASVPISTVNEPVALVTSPSRYRDPD